MYKPYFEIRYTHVLLIEISILCPNGRSMLSSPVPSQDHHCSSLVRSAYLASRGMACCSLHLNIYYICYAIADGHV